MSVDLTTGDFRLKIFKFSLLLIAMLWSCPQSFAAEPSAEGLAPKNWDFYGSARVGGAHWNKADYWKQAVLDAAGNIVSYKTVQDTVPINRNYMDLQYNSRFGVLINSGPMGFHFELGWMPSVQDLDVQIIAGNPEMSQKRRDALRLRLLYGEWKFHPNFKLLVGQDWAITNFFNSNQIFFMDQGLGYSGELSTGRRPMVKLTYAQQKDSVMNWKGEVAVVKSDTSLLVLSQPPAIEEVLPKLEIGGEFGFKKKDVFGIKLQGVAGMQQYDLVVYADVVGKLNAQRKSVKSHLIGENIAIDLFNTTTSLSYTWGKNILPYGVWIGDPDGSKLDEHIRIFLPLFGTNGDPSDTIQHINNVYSGMGSLVFNFHPFKWLSAEVGGGMVNGRHEEQSRKATVKTTLNAMNRLAYYGNLQFTLADGKFLIVPEYSYSDFGGFTPTAGRTAGHWYAYGLKLQMDM